MPPPPLRARSGPHGTERAVTIVVSRRAVSRATERNRIRRRIRAAVAQIGRSPAHPVTLVAEKAAATMPFTELVRAVKDALKRYE